MSFVYETRNISGTSAWRRWERYYNIALNWRHWNLRIIKEEIHIYTQFGAMTKTSPEFGVVTGTSQHGGVEGIWGLQHIEVILEETFQRWIQQENMKKWKSNHDIRRDKKNETVSIIFYRSHTGAHIHTHKHTYLNSKPK